MLDSPKQTILIVDDSPFEREYLVKLLESPDRHIVTAESGEKALEILQSVDIALALLDVHMVGWSGFENITARRKFHCDEIAWDRTCSSIMIITEVLQKDRNFFTWRVIKQMTMVLQGILKTPGYMRDNVLMWFAEIDQG